MDCCLNPSDLIFDKFAYLMHDEDWYGIILAQSIDNKDFTYEIFWFHSGEILVASVNQDRFIKFRIEDSYL